MAHRSSLFNATKIYCAMIFPPFVQPLVIRRSKWKFKRNLGANVRRHRVT